MGDKSAIQWTDATWSPVTGCTKVSPGCANCYITRTPPFRMAGRKFEWVNKAITTGVQLHPERLDQPLKWTRPRRIFVNSLSDLFHEDVPDDFIAAVFGVMAAARWHTFQVLTKRPERMLKVVRSLNLHEVFLRASLKLSDDGFQRFWQAGERPPFRYHWPPPNVWLGVSVENQTWADRRIPLLLQTPAAVRFISAEPLLGPVRLRRPNFSDKGHGRGWIGPDDGSAAGGPTIDWVIAGGESGPKARPMHPDWVRSLRDQCESAGVPFFFKQWGEWKPIDGPRVHGISIDNYPSDSWITKDGVLTPCGSTTRFSPYFDCIMRKVGKSKAGALLDGVEHREFPEVAA